MTPKSWDDIDLGGLTMESSGDDDTSTADEEQRRLHKRIDISNLVGININKTDNIPIDVITTKSILNIKTEDGRQRFKATLQDISAGGIRILSEGLSSVNDILKMNFSIGTRNITVQGIVRWANTDKGKHILGIEFIDPNQNDIEFISSIHSALTWK
jgi:c-di-GMP-binding flagellar brake protein YcgR